MKQVYDFTDEADKKTAGQILANVIASAAWPVLRQLAAHIRERDIRRETDSAASLDRINGRLSGMNALLDTAEGLAKQGVAEAGVEEIAHSILTSIGTGPV